MTTPHSGPEEEFPDLSWEGHRRRQIRRGLELTPLERLRWLESTMVTMRAWLGRARPGARDRGDDPAAPRQL